jgi:preprotein translocase subunit YajC
VWIIALAQEAGNATGDAAQNAAQQGSPGSGLVSMLPMIVLFIAIMYFFLIRPNQKREKERREMLASLSKGDKVVTSGGIYGAIVGLTEKNVVLRISDEPLVKMKLARGAVSRVISRDENGEEEES